MFDLIFNTYRSLDSIKASLMCVHLFCRDVSLKYGKRLAPGEKTAFWEVIVHEDWLDCYPAGYLE